MSLKSSRDPLISYITWRVDKNKNVIMVVNGPTGSGKTYAALYVALKSAEHYNAPFTIKDNMAFSFEDIHKKMQNLRGQVGTPFIIEEVGAVGSGTSSNEWQSRANKLFNSFLQTARHRRQILIMTCPVFTMLEATARRLVHIQATMDSIDFDKKVGYMKPYIIQTNARTGDQYFKLFRYRQGGVQTKMRTYGCQLIPQELIDEYEKEKWAYSKRLDQSIMEDTKMINEKRKRKLHGYQDKKFDPMYLLKLKQQGYTAPEIAKHVGISLDTVKDKLRIASAPKIVV